MLKSILFFSLPYLLSYFLQTLYGMADLFIIGQFEGVASTTAVSIGSQVMHMITVMIVGLAMGATVTIGRAVGAENKLRAARLIGNTVTLFMAGSVVLAAVLVGLVDPIVRIVSTPEQAVAGTRTYLIICFIGVPCITLIRKALTFSAEPPERRQARTQKFLPLYGVSVVLGLVETAAVWAVGLAGTEGAMMLLIINVIFGIVYGAYTLFWMPETLPRYYDENHVCNFAQGAFHMHIPGVYYNNRNWLHVRKAMRVWCVVSMLLTPLCTAAAVVFEQATGWQVWCAVLIGYIASLFGTIVIPAKKYQ